MFLVEIIFSFSTFFRGLPRQTQIEVFRYFFNHHYFYSKILKTFKIFKQIDSKISNSVEIMGILKADTQDILEATQEQQEEQKATAETEMEKEPSY